MFATARDRFATGPEYCGASGRAPPVCRHAFSRHSSAVQLSCYGNAADRQCRSRSRGGLALRGGGRSTRKRNWAAIIGSQRRGNPPISAPEHDRPGQ